MSRRDLTSLFIIACLCYLFYLVCTDQIVPTLDTPPPDLYEEHQPHLKSDAIKQLSMVFPGEYVIHATAPWCPIKTEREPGESAEPDTPCPPEGYRAGTYLVDEKGNLLTESGKVAVYKDISVTMQRCNDLFGLPESFSCFPNIYVRAVDAEVEAKNLNDPNIDYVWAYKMYPHLYQRKHFSNAVVAVFDTGVNPHSDLRVLSGAAFTDISRGTVDDNGHGTHVAGTCCAINDNNAGLIAPGNGVAVLPVKVLGSSGGGSLFAISKGVDYVIDWKKKNPSKEVIANLSLGAYGARSLCDGMRRLGQAGIPAIVAAGNESRNLATYRTYPAVCPQTNVITIAAHDSRNKLSTFSNFGTRVDFTAPGTRIFSTDRDGGYSYKSGTSMATPFVAGLAAQIVGRRESSDIRVLRQRIKERLEKRR